MLVLSIRFDIVYSNVLTGVVQREIKSGKTTINYESELLWEEVAVSYVEVIYLSLIRNK